MPLGDAVETFIRREDAERFIEEVRSDDPGLASYVRIEERGTPELEVVAAVRSSEDPVRALHRPR
jgi:hypothetical protein